MGKVGDIELGCVQERLPGFFCCFKIYRLIFWMEGGETRDKCKSTPE